ncbi:hypothetical protein BaRGS_00026794 [Batillaria attramentaria]|uniref:Uncharacterized protein n=1 Tax=Batillaria attramentaria TaxID=370345 RepID=A0ABD0K4Y8_9CAEN
MAKRDLSDRNINTHYSSLFSREPSRLFSRYSLAFRRSVTGSTICLTHTTVGPDAKRYATVTGRARVACTISVCHHYSSVRETLPLKFSAEP